MAAATTIALAARALSLTLNARTVAGELAVARAAAAIAGGRARRAGRWRRGPGRPAGGARRCPALDEDPARGEGATVRRAGVRRGGARRGERGSSARSSARPRAPSRPVPTVSGGPACRGPFRPRSRRPASPAEAIAWVYDSASGDAARDAWQTRLLTAALAPTPPPRVSLRPRLGAHAGVGALGVAAATWTARAGRLPDTIEAGRAVRRGPGLVYGVARGGTEVALVIG